MTIGALTHYAVVGLLLQTYALYTEAAPVMRRAEREAHLGAGGEMVQVQKHAHLESDSCDRDYPLGNESTCNCSHPGDELILQQELCLQAAKEAGATAHDEEFLVKYDYGQVHPMGCFK